MHLTVTSMENPSMVTRHFKLASNRKGSEGARSEETQAKDHRATFKNKDSKMMFKEINYGSHEIRVRLYK